MQVQRDIEKIIWEYVFFLFTGKYNPAINSVIARQHTCNYIDSISSAPPMHDNSHKCLSSISLPNRPPSQTPACCNPKTAIPL